MSEGAGAPQGQYTVTLAVSPGGGAAPANLTSSGITSKTTSSKTTTTKTTKITKSSSSSTGGSESSSTTTTKTESSSTGADGKSTRSFNTVTTKSSTNFADGLATRIALTGSTDAEVQRLVDEQMTKMNTQNFQLMPSSTTTAAAPGTPTESCVRLDEKSIMDYVDKSNNQQLALNFNMSNYASETVHVKTVGNKVEVHACRTTKSSDGSQTKEEFSRAYEMPTSGVLDANKVTSGLYSDGVLTINVPISEATQ